jgi:hypothetical protein
MTQEIGRDIRSSIENVNGAAPATPRDGPEIRLFFQQKSQLPSAL